MQSPIVDHFTHIHKKLSNYSNIINWWPFYDFENESNYDSAKSVF